MPRPPRARSPQSGGATSAPAGTPDLSTDRCTQEVSKKAEQEGSSFVLQAAPQTSRACRSSPLYLDPPTTRGSWPPAGALLAAPDYKIPLYTISQHFGILPAPLAVASVTLGNDSTSLARHNLGSNSCSRCRERRGSLPEGALQKALTLTFHGNTLLLGKILRFQLMRSTSSTFSSCSDLTA